MPSPEAGFEPPKKVKKFNVATEAPDPADVEGAAVVDAAELEEDEAPSGEPETTAAPEVTPPPAPKPEPVKSAAEPTPAPKPVETPKAPEPAPKAEVAPASPKKTKTERVMDAGAAISNYLKSAHSFTEYQVKVLKMHESPRLQESVGIEKIETLVDVVAPMLDALKAELEAAPDKIDVAKATKLFPLGFQGPLRSILINEIAVKAAEAALRKASGKTIPAPEAAPKAPKKVKKTEAVDLAGEKAITNLADVFGLSKKNLQEVCKEVGVMTVAKALLAEPEASRAAFFDKIHTRTRSAIMTAMGYIAAPTPPAKPIDVAEIDAAQAELVRVADRLRSERDAKRATEMLGGSTGWKEEPPAPLATTTGAPAITTAEMTPPTVETRGPFDSESGALVRSGTARVPLHERMDERASYPELEVKESAEFKLYVQEVGQRGVFTGLGRSNKLELLEDCFEHRALVARELGALYQHQSLKDLGLSGTPKVAENISAYVERLSLEHPEKVLQLRDLVVEAAKIPNRIAELQALRARLVSGEDLREATAEHEEKRKKLALAKSSMMFDGVLAFITRNSGLKEYAAARKEIRKKFGKWGGRLDYAAVDVALADVSAKIGDITTEKGNELTSIEDLIPAYQERLKDIKRQLIQSNAVHEETADIVRKGVAEALGRMQHLEQQSVEQIEDTEKVLGKLKTLAETGGEDVQAMDYLRHVNVDQLKESLRTSAEKSASEALQKVLRDVLTHHEAPNRLGALVAALMPWARRDKIGNFEGSPAVKDFIVEEMKKYIQAELKPALDKIDERLRMASNGLVEEDIAALWEERRIITDKFNYLNAAYSSL